MSEEIFEKTCIGPCGRSLPLSSFGLAPNGKDGHRTDCKFCQNVRHREAHRANPGKRQAYYKERRLKNGDLIRQSERAYWVDAGRRQHKNERSKVWRDKLRLEVVNAYGGFCQCCGMTDIFCLTLDHVNSDGAEHRKQIGASQSWTRLYQWAKDNGYPPNLRCLCLNCNRAAFYNDGVCPHQQELNIVALATERFAIAA